MPSIFISYRRADAPGHAGRLYDRFVERFGKANVFKDLDTMEPGADFGDVIDETVSRCDALIAVIGRHWVRAGDESAGALDDSRDWVRREIAKALARKIHVIPILVDGTQLPSEKELPQDVRPLVRRHAVHLSEVTWTLQVAQLMDALEMRLGGPSRRRSAADPESAPRRQGRSGFPTERFEMDDGNPDQDATIHGITWLTPIGQGSRATFIGGSGAGKSVAMRKVAGALSVLERVQVLIALAGSARFEVGEWEDNGLAPHAVVRPDATFEEQRTVVDGLLDEAALLIERHYHVVICVDALDALDRRLVTTLFDATRCGTTQSLTVIGVAAETIGGESTVTAFNSQLARVGKFPPLDMGLSHVRYPERLIGVAGAEALRKVYAETSASADQPSEERSIDDHDSSGGS
jgi:hypothetical protein